jgi:hypothetical protein
MNFLMVMRIDKFIKGKETVTICLERNDYNNVKITLKYYMVGKQRECLVKDDFCKRETLAKIYNNWKEMLEKDGFLQIRNALEYALNFND